MKSFKLLLGQSLLMIAALVFLMGQNTIAQDKKEEGKVVKIKIAKKVDGDYVIDTIFTSSLEDLEGVDLKKELQKVIDIDLEGMEGMEELQDMIISVDVDGDFDEDSDTDKDINVWYTKEEDGSGKVIKLRCKDSKHNVMVYSGDGDDTTVMTTKTITIKTGEDGENIIYMSAGEKGENVWISDDIEKIDVEKGYFCIMKTDGDSNEFTITSKYVGDDEGEHVFVYTTEEDGEYQKFNVYARKAGDDEALIDMYKFDDDDGTSIIIIKSLQVGSIEEEDIEVLDKAGIKLLDKKMDLEDLKFFPNPNDGKFTLSFETESKGDLEIRIVDVNGKIVHQESFNNFTGKYNKEIDITDNSKGTYFLIIQQGKSMSAHKILYK